MPVRGTGNFSDLFVGNPDSDYSQETVPVLGPSGISYTMGGELVVPVEPVVGATADITLLASEGDFTIQTLVPSS